MRYVVAVVAVAYLGVWLQGETTIYNEEVTYVSLPTVWSQLLEQCK